MSCDRLYNILSYDEWFERFLTPHPQLIYTDNIKLLELQSILSKHFYEKQNYTKQQILDIYKHYKQTKLKNETIFLEFKEHIEEKLNKFKDDINNSLNTYIDDIIKNL